MIYRSELTCPFGLAVEPEKIYDMKMKNEFGEISQEKAEFLVQKVEVAMDQLIFDRENLQKKANWVLGIIGAAITLGIGQLMDEKSALKSHTQFLLIEVFLLMILGTLIVLFCILPKKYPIKGGSPKLLLKKEFFSQKYPYLLVGYANLLQRGIDENQKQLVSFSQWIKWTTVATICSPIIAVIIQCVIPVRC